MVRQKSTATPNGACLWTRYLQPGQILGRNSGLKRNVAR